MVLLSRLLSLSALSEFRVVSGFNGINTPVNTIGFFDCETGADFGQRFFPGQLVFTTLSAEREHPDRIVAGLAALINRGVAAIAIKDTFVQDISDEIRELSEIRSVPILFFSTPSLDEALCAVHFELKRMNNDDTEKTLMTLIHTDDLTPIEITDLAYRLNPYFRENITMCAFVSIAGEDENIPEILWEQYLSGVSPFKAGAVRQGKNMVLGEWQRFTVLPYKRGLFFISTATEHECLLADPTVAPLEQFLAIDDTYRIGYSTTCGSISKMQIILREALYSNISTVIDECPVTHYRELYVDKLLCSTTRFNVSREVYTHLKNKLISTAEKANAEDFIATLNSYVQLNCDIKAVANALYQHPNTIRYRIAKIKKAWNCMKDVHFTTTATVFVRLEGFLKLMDLS